MGAPFQHPGARKTSRPFEARFPGICENCSDGFEQGDMVMFEDDQLVHADPDDCNDNPVRPVKTACPDCFLVHAGECF